jgi:hypothetical protein
VVVPWFMHMPGTQNAVAVQSAQSHVSPCSISQVPSGAPPRQVPAPPAATLPPGPALDEAATLPPVPAGLDELHPAHATPTVARVAPAIRASVLCMTIHYWTKRALVNHAPEACTC